MWFRPEKLGFSLSEYLFFFFFFWRPFQFGQKNWLNLMKDRSKPGLRLFDVVSSLQNSPPPMQIPGYAPYNHQDTWDQSNSYVGIVQCGKSANSYWKSNVICGEVWVDFFHTGRCHMNIFFYRGNIWHHWPAWRGWEEHPWIGESKASAWTWKNWTAGNRTSSIIVFTVVGCPIMISAFLDFFIFLWLTQHRKLTRKKLVCFRSFRSRFFFFFFLSDFKILVEIKINWSGHTKLHLKTNKRNW